MSWNFCQYVAQQIEEIAGEEFYKKHGQEVLGLLMIQCEENFDIVRYPEDEEILILIEKIRKRDSV